MYSKQSTLVHCIADLIIHIIPAVNIINNLSKLTDITKWVSLIERCDLTFGMYVYSHETTAILTLRLYLS